MGWNPNGGAVVTRSCAAPPTLYVVVGPDGFRSAHALRSSAEEIVTVWAPTRRVAGIEYRVYEYALQVQS